MKLMYQCIQKFRIIYSVWKDTSLKIVISITEIYHNSMFKRQHYNSGITILFFLKEGSVLHRALFEGKTYFNKLWLSFDKRANLDLRLTKHFLNLFWITHGITPVVLHMENNYWIYSDPLSQKYRAALSHIDYNYFF